MSDRYPVYEGCECTTCRAERSGGHRNKKGPAILSRIRHRLKHRGMEREDD